MFLETRCFRIRAKETAVSGMVAGALLAVRFPHNKRASGPLAGLSIQTRRGSLAVCALQLLKCLTDLKTFLRENLTRLDAETRIEIIGFLTAPLPAYSGTNLRSLSRNLVVVRDALRERLPGISRLPQQDKRLGIDQLLEIDPYSFYVNGHILEGNPGIQSLTIISPEGCRNEVLSGAFRFPKSKRDGAGDGASPPSRSCFSRFFGMNSPSYFPNAWMGEIRTESGTSFEFICPPPTRDLRFARNAILTDLAGVKSAGGTLLAEHVFPAITRIQERLHDGAKARGNVLQYGSPHKRPGVSIIVALNDSSYWLEQQLAQFAMDPEFQKADLIYLVDSAEPADALEELADPLSQLYGIPFRIVTLKGRR